MDYSFCLQTVRNASNNFAQFKVTSLDVLFCLNQPTVQNLSAYSYRHIHLREK